MTSGARGAVIKAQFSVLFAYVCVCVSFFFLGGGGVVSDFKRSGCRQNFYLTPLPPSLLFVFFLVPTHNSLFNTGDSYLNSVHT